jgi:hypothetical protein
MKATTLLDVSLEALRKSGPAGGLRARDVTRADAPTAFSWSIAKLRKAAVILALAAAPAALGVAASGLPAARALCLAWLAAAAALMHGVSRRAAAAGAVLEIDGRGILDRRLMAQRILWHEIAAVYPVDLECGQVADLRLRYPAMTLAGSRWPTRIGVVCQNRLGVPAVTISMLLLDGDVAALLAAIARHRPDLVPVANRRRLQRM